MLDTHETVQNTARQLVDLYQEDAPTHATVRSGQLASSGDLCGSAHWLEVSSNAAKLLSERMSAGPRLRHHR